MINTQLRYFEINIYVNNSLSVPVVTLNVCVRRVDVDDRNGLQVASDRRLQPPASQRHGHPLYPELPGCLAVREAHHPAPPRARLSPLSPPSSPLSSDMAKVWLSGSCGPG